MVFVIRCLYSAVREQHFIRIIYYYYVIVLVKTHCGEISCQYIYIYIFILKGGGGGGLTTKSDLFKQKRKTR